MLLKNLHNDPRKLKIYLVLILTIKILGYYSLLLGGEATVQAIKIALRVSMTGLLGLIYIVLRSQFGSGQQQINNPLPFGAYALYLLLGCFSLLWSSDWGFSLIQLLMAIESAVFVIILFKLITLCNAIQKESFHISEVLAYSVFILTCWLIIGAFVQPDVYFRLTHHGSVARLGGLLQNPNEVGMMSVVGTILTFCMMQFKGAKWYMIVMVLIFGYSVFLTQSRSSTFAFFLVSTVYIFQHGSKSVKTVFIILVLTGSYTVFQTIFLKEGNVEEVVSMTGRTPFWNALLTEGLPREPLLGNGFMRLSFSHNFYTERAMNASMAHNTFIEVLMNLGMLGGFIVLGQIVLTAHAVASEKNKAHQFFGGFLLMELLLNSMTEFGIFGHNNYAILYYQILLASFLFRTDKRVSKLQLLKIKMSHSHVKLQGN